jgi:sigma-B regulation protein RsbU (phosphoserine phosphatase)
MLINFAAVAIDNSNLIKARLVQQEQDRELAFARQIQETILPLSFDDVPGVEIGAAYFPMGEVGGDFYDVIRLNDNEFVLVLGDVSSHGVPAALVMSATAGIIKTLLKENPGLPVGDLTAQTNTLLADEIIKDRDMFVTLFLCRFRADTKELTYCNAGHLPGLYWDATHNEIVELADGGPIVGQFGGIPFKQGQRPIASGDRLFLFTDGLTEAADADGNLFGRERVEQVYSTEMGLDPNEFCSRVKQWVDRYTEGAPEETRDDFTILQLRVK